MQLTQCLVFGNVPIPPVSRRDSGIESCVRIGEPLGANIVEVGQRARLEFLRRGLVTGDRPRGITEDRFVHPLHPFGRV